METRQTVVVTGASAGIGRATAVAFARQGARVALLARGMPGLRAAQREIEAAGGQALALPVDLCDSAQIEAAADEVERSFGPIDVWVNNAMATLYAPLDAIDPADFRRATELCYFGTVWGTMAALRRMKRRDRGVVVQVGSALSDPTIPLQAPYSGAKAAVRGFTDALRGELAREGSHVRLTMVQFAAFNMPQFEGRASPLGCLPRPAGPVFRPERVARAIVRASRGGRPEWWVGWPALKAALKHRLRPGAPAGTAGSPPGDGGAPAAGLPPAGAATAALGMRGAAAGEAGLPQWMQSHRGTLLAATAALAGTALLVWWRDRQRP